MSAINLDVGVFGALKAYKKEKGMSDAAATAWANAHLAEGLSRVRAAMRLPENSRDAAVGTTVAFRALKVWAQGKP